MYPPYVLRYPAPSDTESESDGFTDVGIEQVIVFVLLPKDVPEEL